MKKKDNFDAIAMMLKSDSVAIKQDCNNFLKYEKGEITIDECIERFKLANDIPPSTFISKRKMAKWLRGQGYIVC